MSADSAPQQVAANKCFGGYTRRYKHSSSVLGCNMNFTIFFPPGSEGNSGNKVPVLYYLSGLTCTDENVMQKAGAQRSCAQHGIAFVAPDTSPRGLNVEGEADSWDFGVGAGFYINAIADKWKNWRMYDYITQELPAVLSAHFANLDTTNTSIMGHSMGGHGALTIALKNPGKYKSLSAFAPICNPCNVPWGIKAFTGYFGEDNKELWKAHDATELVKSYHGPPLPTLIDTGTADTFLEAQAGINQGHSKRKYAAADWYLNHKPAPVANSIPAAFNWCNNDGTNYCTASWNQHIPVYCGSCWVHGTLSMVQDRLKIKKLRAGDITPDVMLGRQTLLNCAAFHGYGEGCNGGEPLDVFKYMAEEGLPDESCFNYGATDHTQFKSKAKKSKDKTCPKKARCQNCMPDPKGGPDRCWAVEKPIEYKLTAYGKIDAGEEAMQQEILARGPITCGIACPDSFVYHYHSSRHNGVYIDKSGDKELDHDVEVVGWGEEDGLKYWLVRNSWGTYWGELGFFKVQRGVNALQIESGDCWYAEPEYAIETAVVDEELEGSMYGLKEGHPEGADHHRHFGRDSGRASINHGDTMHSRLGSKEWMKRDAVKTQVS
eukprot:gene2117-2436_t